MRQAGPAKERVCTMFMTQPSTPVSLTVTISRTATTTDTAQAVMGPQISPPSVTTTSEGSYFRNRTTGIRPTAMTR